MSLAPLKTGQVVKLADLGGRIVAATSAKPAPVGAAAPRRVGAGPGVYALGRMETGRMNATEERYAAHLAARQAAGDVHWFAFEAVKFRLADLTFYTPDFLVLPASLVLEVHEVKGHWEDDARVKIKVAASLFPFRFYGIKQKSKKAGGGFEVEDFSS